MNLTIELTPDEARRLENAKAHGLDVTAMVKGILSGLPDPCANTENAVPKGVRPNDNTIKLLEQWRQEDATDDAEELERRDRETAEFMANLRANRLTFRVPEL